MSDLRVDSQIMLLSSTFFMNDTHCGVYHYCQSYFFPFCAIYLSFANNKLRNAG